MGRYFNPVQDLPTVGRRLMTGDFQAMATQLRTGEKILGLYDRGVFKLAPVIDDAKELEEFESQYCRGMLLSHAHYAVPESAFAKHVA